jgi:hypothetical protein
MLRTLGPVPFTLSSMREPWSGVPCRYADIPILCCSGVSMKRAFDYTSGGLRPRERWVLGGSILDPTGLLIPGPYLTWAGPSVTLGTAAPSYTWQPVVLKPGVNGAPSPGRVLIDRIEGNIQDVTDVCGSPVPTWSTETSGSIVSAADSDWVSDPISVSGGYPVYGTHGTLSFSSTTSGSFSVSVCPCGSGFISRLTIGVYVSQLNSKTGLWSILDPNVTPTDAIRDYESLISDSYHLPYTPLSVPYSGRSWPVVLPRPIIIGPGQALHVTVSIDTAGDGFDIALPTYQAAFRTRARILQ